VVFPYTLTDGVTKVPKAPLTPFCHFWHLVTLACQAVENALRIEVCAGVETRASLA
jgi:hypothetical protein